MLTHQPGDSNEAMKMNSKINEMVDAFRRGIMQYYRETVEKQEDVEDGVVKYIE